MRIDPLNAEIVASRQLRQTPEILKILFRGTKADLGILERIRKRHITLDAFWRETVGVAGSGRLRGSGNGYQKLRPTSPIYKSSHPQRGVDASLRHDMREVTAGTFKSIFVDHESLNMFASDRVHRARSEELFTGPLVIVHQSPRAKTGRIDVAVSDDDVVFSETFYGYSPLGVTDAAVIVRYLALVIGSKLAIWLALITSGKFGFEREVIEKATLDSIPLPDFRQLGPCQRNEIVRLFEGLRRNEMSWDDVDEWVTRLYGLGPRDLQVVVDTLEFNLPFAANKGKAQEAPSVGEMERFCDLVAEELRPWSRRLGAGTSGVLQVFAVDHSSLGVASGWCNGLVGDPKGTLVKRIGRAWS